MTSFKIAQNYTTVAAHILCKTSGKLGGGGGNDTALASGEGLKYMADQNALYFCPLIE